MGTHNNTDNYENGWEAHSMAQLCRFRALSLHQKLEAVEGMADVAGRLGEMRRQQAFHSSADESYQGEGGIKETGRLHGWNAVASLKPSRRTHVSKREISHSTAETPWLH